MIISEQEFLDGEHLEHIGTLHKSGRYPWGSGGTENQQNKNFLEYVDDMKRQGLSDSEIAKGLGMKRVELQTRKLLAKSEQKAADVTMANMLAAKGMSNMEIGRAMNRNESSVRALRAPVQKVKADILGATANMLMDQVDKKGYVDVGVGVEHHLLGVSRTTLDKAITVAQLKGYPMFPVQIDQLGTNNKTTVKVLAPPGTEYKEVAQNKDKIKSIMEYTDDAGLTWSGIQPPLSISSDRVKVRWKEDGGGDADGMLYIRRGVPDISLGKSNYAQVRVAVDDTHYLKGVAIYRDDLPKGTDIVFNSVKNRSTNKLDAMKPLKADKKTGEIDEANPFGAVVHQLPKLDAAGLPIKNTVRSSMNIVNEEGDWGNWSKNLSSQMLSKQNPDLAEKQLGETFAKKKLDLDEISSLTNPVVRMELLKSYSDAADSSAVHLKAAAMPRQSSHVIIPIPSLKDNEVYAPNFDNGERVVLIRYPHGGIFEIPELTVNNRHPEARKILGSGKNSPPDAIGINAKVAERLSGADFDGDTVLVIPNNKGLIKTSPPLARLIGFDPKVEYKGYEGMIPMTVHAKGTQMGIISNLITDMTIKGASPAELARAVRHSMVVIDAEKHKLNYRQSAKDNGIRQLKVKYQSDPNGKGTGASTLISQATARADPLRYKPRSSRDGQGGPIDKATGKLVMVPTGEHYNETKLVIDPSTGKQTRVETGKVIYNTQRSQRLVETDNAHTLSSGTKIEAVYADHSNRMKNLANVARKEMVNTKVTPYQPSAKAAYPNEVGSLNAKLILALRNAPLERQAQVLAGAKIKALQSANEDMEKSEIKKLKFLALDTARNRVGAGKEKIFIEDKEWEAIQAGAISNDKLSSIIRNSDLDRVKALATPRTQLLMTSSKKSRALDMIANGKTQAEVANALGVSLTTLKTNLSEGG